jgi:hypothetical protein
LSKIFHQPARQIGKSAQRIARLETLVTAMADALRASNRVIIEARCHGEIPKEIQDRSYVQTDENADLCGTARYYLGEGRSL